MEEGQENEMYCTKLHMDIWQVKVSQGNFLTGLVVAGGGFLSYWNHQLIKFEEEKRFGLNTNFVIMKREK